MFFGSFLENPHLSPKMQQNSSKIAPEPLFQQRMAEELMKRCARGEKLNFYSFSNRGGKSPRLCITYLAAAAGFSAGSVCMRAGRIIRMVERPSLFGAIKSFFSLSPRKAVFCGSAFRVCRIFL